MKIIVTGGIGFIGYHLCVELLLQGHYVFCIDNHSSSNKKNLEKLSKFDNFRFICHDIIHPIPFIDKVNQIYHLACPASPVYYQSNPIHTIKTCVIGTLNVLDLAVKNNSKVLFTSTSEIYGDPHISPQNEEYRGNVNPFGPRACYDEGKRMGETILFEYHDKYNLPICIARLFNTYGPNMNANDGRVVSNIINQCLQNKPITIYGDGSQTRSFCYVSDTVSGLIKLMNNTIIKPINIGNPHEITIKELSELCIQFISPESHIIYKDLPTDDPKIRNPDISKAKKILNWEPKVPLETGLKKTIEYFKLY
tara:strand:- start:7131 stop:8057 length:927 start_codon:yes stop_codon:yes gene_type:complete